VFAGTDRPEIYSHQLVVDRVPDLGRAGRDGGDQFGSTLPDALYSNGGTGTEFGRPAGPAAMKTGPLPLPESERAQRIVALAGGVPQTLSRGRDAHATGDFRWAAELADVVLAVDAANVEVKRLKAQALTEVGERQTSANARN
jgi:hypothetical protein